MLHRWNQKGPSLFTVVRLKSGLLRFCQTGLVQKIRTFPFLPNRACPKNPDIWIGRHGIFFKIFYSRNEYIKQITHKYLNNLEKNIQASVIEQANSSCSFSSFSISWLLTSGSEDWPKCANFLYPVIFQLDLIKSDEIFLNISVACSTACSSLVFMSLSFRFANQAL